MTRTLAGRVGGAVTVFAALAVSSGGAAACGDGDRCTIGDPPPGAPAPTVVPTDADGDGSVDPDTVPWGYYAALPADWDGRSPMPTVLYFHGWNGSGEGAMAAAGLSQPFVEAGWLFLAADGRASTWAHQGSPAHRDPNARDEFAYVRAVLDDASQRFPIDETRLLAAGFSQGGSMVWDLACNRPDWFAAFAPVAGAFWEPLPETCVPADRRVRHIHGTADTVVPMEGRPIGDRWRQGDLGESLDRLLTAGVCSADPEPVAALADGASCRRWAFCDGDTRIDICLHDGGHRRPEGWAAATLAWMNGLSAPR